MSERLFVYLFSFLAAAFPLNQSKPKMAQDWQKLVPHYVAVESNQTLSSIATVLYGRKEYWTLVWKDNAWIENPNYIQTGWKLRVRSEKPKLEETGLSEDLAQRYTMLSRPKIARQIAAASVDLVHHEPQPSIPSASSQQDLKSSDFDDLYKKAGEKYNVPWQVLYGIHLTETGLRGSSPITNHGGSGATGPMQFMPGTWLAYGQDCNNDGVADITNVEDAVCGAANFIQKHGSIADGLRYYGGNTKGTLTAAIARGYDPSENP